MVRELHDRDKSALLLVFEPSPEGSYDLADVPDAKLKCIATEDITPQRFSQLVSSFGKRFAPRKPAPAPVKPPEPSVIGQLSGTPLDPDAPYELKGDQLNIASLARWYHGVGADAVWNGTDGFVVAPQP